jgi:hypothetical protein
MRLSALAVTLAFATAASTLACAVPDLPPDDPSADEQASTDPTPTETTPPKRDTGTASPSTGGSGSGTGTSPPPSSTPDAGDAAAPPTNACATAATEDACFRCCDVANPNAIPLLNDELANCQCGVPGMCAAVCASQYCGGQATIAGGACDNCLLANDASCRTQAETKCAATSTCKPYLTCTNDAKCASKPM